MLTIQLPLDFTVRKAFRRSDPETSQLAAEANKKARGEQRQRVRECLLLAGQHGATDYEIANALGILRTSAGKRRHELGAKDSGERRTTDTGSKAVVWVLQPEESNK